ncbi:unnamed protein product [Discosporangium mesarthrocarpum]
MTWLDITNPVHALARHMQTPSETLWKAGLIVLKFLQMTHDWGLTFQKTGHMILHAYADSSYAGDEDDRCSVSGGAVMFAGSAVAWYFEDSTSCCSF